MIRKLINRWLAWRRARAERRMDEEDAAERATDEIDWIGVDEKQ